MAQRRALPGAAMLYARCEHLMGSDWGSIGWPIDSLGVGGGLDRAGLFELVRSHRVGAIVDLRVEGPEDDAVLRELGLRVLNLPTQDCCAPSPRALQRGVAWVNQRINAGDRVYIHCQYGVGRSAALALCVLISRGMTPRQAVAALKRVRPLVAPSRAQLGAVLRWTRRHYRDQGRPAPPETLEDLSRIAWSAGQEGTGTLCDAATTGDSPGDPVASP